MKKVYLFAMSAALALSAFAQEVAPAAAETKDDSAKS